MRAGHRGEKLLRLVAENNTEIRIFMYRYVLFELGRVTAETAARPDLLLKILVETGCKSPACQVANYKLRGARALLSAGQSAPWQPIESICGCCAPSGGTGRIGQRRKPH